MVQIILASNSPRRKKIMTDLGLDFEIIPSKYDEKLETVKMSNNRGVTRKIMVYLPNGFMQPFTIINSII